MSLFRRLKKPLKIILVVVGIPAVCLGVHLGYNFFTDNVHTVLPGEIYRTAQLDANQLAQVTKKFQLKTIINLRGVWPQDHWYQMEVEFAKNHGVAYYPLQFSAYSLPSKAQLHELVQLLLTAPQPLVLHCEGGADRTGMAAAISLILYSPHSTLAEIKRQASWHYNAISRYTVGYQVLMNYFAWLKQHHYQQSKEHFLVWVNSPDKMKPYQGWFWV